MAGASAAELEAAFNEPAPGNGPPRVGHDFGTRYRIQKTLGAGGMGVVYQALDRELGVQIALKVLRPIVGSPKTAPDMQRRFTAELLLARRITHKNVIRIHDIGEINGIRFISMPYIEGGDLATPLADGPLPIALTFRYARHLAAGLMAVHAAGVIHRDIKPANIMVDEQDQAVLMDFGIARSTAPGALQRTSPGALVGTIAYMAPEQTRGEPVDQRTDIYAFGLVLSEMLLGTRDLTPADVFGRLKAAPTPPRQINADVPEGLDAIVTRCLQPNPANRYQTSVELAKALAAVSRGEGQRDEPSPFAALSKRWLPRAGVLLLLLALLGLGYWGIRQGALSAMARGAGEVKRSIAKMFERQAPVAATQNEPAPAAPSAPARDARPPARSPRSPMPTFSTPAAARASYQRLAATAGPEGVTLAAAGFADVALYEKKPAEAVQVLERALAQDDPRQNRGRRAANYLALAEARASLGRNDAALESVHRALATSREEGVLVPAARMLVSLRRDDEARALASELARGAYENGRAYGQLIDAEIELAQRNVTGAIDTLKAALEHSDLWLLHYVLGDAYLQSQQFMLAADQLQMCEVRRNEAADLFVPEVPSYRYLAMLDALRERVAQAIAQPRSTRLR